MKNTHSFYIVFQALRVLFKRICKIQLPNRLFQVFFILTFLSADIIFHKLLELYLTLSENIFATNLSLLTDSLNCPTPPSSYPPKFTKSDESFVSMLPN